MSKTNEPGAPSTTANPFERYELDPREGPVGITEQLRDLAEDAADEATRDEIRAAWEALTRDPNERIVWALRAHPRVGPIGAAPLERPRPRRTKPAQAAPTPADYISPPSVEAALSTAPSDIASLDLPMDEDPVLMRSAGTPAQLTQSETDR